MPLFDTHAHYHDAAFDQDRKGLLDALPDAGVGAVVIPALFVPPAFLCHGREAGLLALILALIMLSRHIRELGRILRGEVERKFRGR